MPDIKNKLLQKQLDGTIVTVQDSLPFKVPYNLLEDSKTSDNPSTVPIEVTPSHGYDGMRKVIVPSIHDGNLRPENIIEGVTILGVEGTATTDNLQYNKTINPPLHTTTFDPNLGFRGMEHVTVNGVLDSEPSLVPENIKKNVSIYGVVGEYDGSNPQYDGTTDMYVGDEEGIKTGDLSVYDADLIPSNIRNGVTIFGVTGTYGGGSANIQPVTGIVLSANQTTITKPSNIDGMSSVSFKLNDSLKSIIKAGETILGVEGEYYGYEGSDNLYVGKDTDVQNGDYYINDSNLKPENIKENVVIFGIKGTYTGSGGDPTGDENLYVGNNSKDSSISNGDYIIKDSELIDSNIKSGVTIFGVEGTYGSFNNATDIFNDGRWFSNFGYLNKYSNSSINRGDSARAARIDYSDNNLCIFYVEYMVSIYTQGGENINIPNGKTGIKVTVDYLYDGVEFLFYAASSLNEATTDLPSQTIKIDRVMEYTYYIPNTILDNGEIPYLVFRRSGTIPSSLVNDIKIMSISHIEFV